MSLDDLTIVVPDNLGQRVHRELMEVIPVCSALSPEVNRDPHFEVSLERLALLELLRSLFPILFLEVLTFRGEVHRRESSTTHALVNGVRAEWITP